LNSSLPFTGSPPAVAAGLLQQQQLGSLLCIEVKEKASIKAKLKNTFLEVDLWLPTFS
jgi:hypothetical protein